MVALTYEAACAASSLDECLYPTPQFSNPAPTTVVLGNPGSRIRIHPVHPVLCASAEAGLCRGTAYVVPGDRVDVARRCGEWVYARFVAKRHTTSGWIGATQLSGAVPVDSVNIPNSLIDVSKVPMCAHHWLWATHGGQFVGQASRLIAVHARNPMLCSDSNAGLCGNVTLIRPGKSTYYSDSCGDWIYVSPRDSEGSHATGWVHVGDVTELPGTAPTEMNYRLALVHDPLYEAVINNNQVQVRAIVAAGRNLNEPIAAGPPSASQYAFLILSSAIKEGNVEMVRLLLSLGADPNIPDPDPGYSCQLAAASENVEIVSALIRAGADVNCGRYGWPLKWAAGNLKPVNIAVLKALIAAHATVDIDHGAPLRAAIDRNNVEGAQLLLAAGAIVNPDAATNAFAGGPPLVKAVVTYRGHWDPTMVIVLLDAGADPNYLFPETSLIGEESIQSLLAFAANAGDYEIVRILLQHGAHPGLARPGGPLPAEVAKMGGHLDIAALIERYATPSKADEKSR